MFFLSGDTHGKWMEGRKEGEKRERRQEKRKERKTGKGHKLGCSLQL